MQKAIFSIIQKLIFCILKIYFLVFKKRIQKIKVRLQKAKGKRQSPRLRAYQLLSSGIHIVHSTTECSSGALLLEEVAS